MAKEGRPAYLADQWRGPGMPRLLLVDDDEMTRRSSRRFLSRAGFDVTTVDSGAEALAYLDANKRVDAVIVDYDMPGMNGVELLRAIHERDPHLPKGLWSASTALRELDAKDLGLAWFVKDKMRPIGELVQGVCFAIYGMQSPFEDASGGSGAAGSGGGGRDTHPAAKQKLPSGWHRRDDVMARALEADPELSRGSSSR